MADSSPADRRDAHRAPIELKVEYKRLNTFFADYTRNISKGGTFIKTQRPLDIGTEFIFALGVPSLETPLRLRGCVQWVVTNEQATSDSPAGMGIRFLYETDADRHAVEALVEQLMSTELGEALSSRLLGRPPRALPARKPRRSLHSRGEPGENPHARPVGVANPQRRPHPVSASGEILELPPS